MYAVGKLAGRTLVALAVVGFTLSSVTCPLIPKLAFLTASFQDDIKLMLGPWGGCAIVGGVQDCPHSAFGFSLNLVNFPGRTETGESPIIARLTYAMILFPLTAFLALIAVCLHSIGRTRKPQLAGGIVAGLSLACATAGAIFMFIIFVNAKTRINAQFDGSPASLGPAVWLVVAAWAILLFGTLLLAGSIEPKRAAALDKQNYYSMESQSDFNVSKTVDKGSNADFTDSHDYYEAADYFKSDPVQPPPPPPQHQNPTWTSADHYYQAPQRHSSQAYGQYPDYGQQPSEYYEAQATPRSQASAQTASPAQMYQPSYNQVAGHSPPAPVRYAHRHTSSSGSGELNVSRVPAAY